MATRHTVKRVEITTTDYRPLPSKMTRPQLVAELRRAGVTRPGGLSRASKAQLVDLAVRQRYGASPPAETVEPTQPEPAGGRTCEHGVYYWAACPPCVLSGQLTQLLSDRHRYTVLAWLADRNNAAQLAAMKDELVVANRAGRTYAQTAEVLGISVNAVNQAVARHNRRTQPSTREVSNA